MLGLSVWCGLLDGSTFSGMMRARDAKSHLFSQMADSFLAVHVSERKGGKVPRTEILDNLESGIVRLFFQEAHRL